MHVGNCVCNLAGCFPLPFPCLLPQNFHLNLFIFKPASSCTASQQLRSQNPLCNPSFVPIDHLAAQNLGVGSGVVPNLKDRWCPFSCCRIHTTSLQLGLWLQTWGCNPVFTSWALRLRKDRRAVNKFFRDFGRIWDFWQIFAEVRGVFGVGNFVGFWFRAVSRWSWGWRHFWEKISRLWACGLGGWESGAMILLLCNVALWIALCYDG